jgi:predicted DNA-binding protein with PD1-like motif
MEYTQGRIGRVFVLKFDDGDVVLENLKRFAKEVFLVIEAVVFELEGVKATKAIDLKTGLNLLKILA